MYELALALSKQSGFLFASAAYLARCTAYKAPATIRGALRKLCDEGWLQRIAGNRDGARCGAKFTPNTFQVVLHAQWADAHPGRCGSEPYRVIADTDELAGADTGTFTGADTALTGNNLSIELSKRTETGSPPPLSPSADEARSCACGDPASDIIASIMAARKPRGVLYPPWQGEQAVREGEPDSVAS